MKLCLLAKSYYSLFIFVIDKENLQFVLKFITEVNNHIGNLINTNNGHMDI